jgi:hypothetical protein
LEGVMNGTSDTGVPHAAELLAFADAAVAFDRPAIDTARAALVGAIGEPAMIDAAAVIAGFNGITRIADASGIPLDAEPRERSAAWRGPLGIDAFAGAKS